MFKCGYSNDAMVSVSSLATPHQKHQRVAILETIRRLSLMSDAELEKFSGAFSGEGYRDKLARVEASFATDKPPRMLRRALSDIDHDKKDTTAFQDLKDMRESEHFVKELCSYAAGYGNGGAWWRLVAHHIRYAWDDTDYIHFFVVTHTQGGQRDDSPFRFARRDDMWVDPRFTTLAEICAYNPVTLALLRGVQAGGQLAPLCALALYDLWD